MYTVKKMKQFYSWNILSQALGASACIMAITTYILDYFFGYTGCMLCNIERIILIIVGIWTICTLSGWITWGLWCLGLGVSGYHIAVQEHWLPLAAFCKAPVPLGDTLASQMENFLSRPVISCDQVTLRILGISAVYFLCIFFALGCVLIFWKTIHSSKKKHLSS